MPALAATRLVTLLALALATVVVAVGVGSVPIDWLRLASAEAETARIVLFELRLPRALAAFCVGALLALSGALMQVLLRNPLADPYLLGVSGGAAVGALGAITLGAAGALVSGAAFGGALASVLIVFALAAGDGSFTHARLLLTGVVTAAGWGAVIALILALAPEAQLKGMVFWLLGDLSGVRSPWLPFVTLVAALGLALPAGKSLNVLAGGELSAMALGVRVVELRRLLYVLASACAAVAVTTAGSIGFVGLVAPHLTRLALGADHRLLLPAAAMVGGTLLTAADTVARTALSPTQLPVGAITALIGVPLFLYLLRRR